MRGDTDAQKELKHHQQNDYSQPRAAAAGDTGFQAAGVVDGADM